MDEGGIATFTSWLDCTKKGSMCMLKLARIMSKGSYDVKYSVAVPLCLKAVYFITRTTTVKLTIVINPFIILLKESLVPSKHSLLAKQH